MFHGSFLQIDTCERCNKFCKLAFKIQGSHVIEKCSNGEYNLVSVIKNAFSFIKHIILFSTK